jgi:hypothetical protein
MVRTASLPTLGLLALLVVAPARAAESSGTCVGPQSVSSINQYCESVPTPTGANTPGPGTPALSTTLTPRASNALSSPSRRSGGRRKLLRLPAPVRAPSPAALVDASTDGLALPWLLIVTLILVAVVLGVAARRRHRHATTT